jgi:transcriptional regulator with XRE-family HTH domain
MPWTVEEVGAYLKELRERAGLSHDRLGERVGKTRSQLIAYEQGRHEPGATFLMAAFDELGVQLVPPAPRTDPQSISAELRDLRESVDKRLDGLTSLVEEALAQERPEGVREDHPSGGTPLSARDVLP